MLPCTWLPSHAACLGSSFPFLFSQMKFIVCASLKQDCLVSAITADLERFAGLYEGDKRVIILQIDEIATDPRARYYGPKDEVGVPKLGLFSQPLFIAVDMCVSDEHLPTPQPTDTNF